MSVAEDLRARVRQKRPPVRLEGAAYDALKLRVFVRAHGLCEDCKTARATDPHHVVFRSHGGDDSEENLRALCRPCHDARHGLRTRR